MSPIFDNVLAFATALGVIILGVMQLVKNTIVLPKNVVPLVGLIIGLAIGALAYPFTDLDLVLRLWAGGIAGLSSTGFFELAFNKREGYTKVKNEDI